MQQRAHLIIFFVLVNQMDLWGSSQLFAMVVATRTWPNYVLQHLSPTCSTVTSFHVTSFFFKEFLSHTFSRKDGFHICSFLAYLFNSQFAEILQWEAAVGNSSSLLMLWPFYSPGKMSTAESGVVTTNQHNWYARYNLGISSWQFTSFRWLRCIYIVADTFSVLEDKYTTCITREGSQCPGYNIFKTLLI